jgi:hypothetical protein
MKSIFRDYAAIMILALHTLGVGIYAVYTAWQQPVVPPSIILLIGVLFLLIIALIWAVVQDHRARARHHRH